LKLFPYADDNRNVNPVAASQTQTQQPMSSVSEAVTYLRDEAKHVLSNIKDQFTGHHDHDYEHNNPTVTATVTKTTTTPSAIATATATATHTLKRDEHERVSERPFSHDDTNTYRVVTMVTTDPLSSQFAATATIEEREKNSPSTLHAKHTSTVQLPSGNIDSTITGNTTTTSTPIN